MSRRRHPACPRNGSTGGANIGVAGTRNRFQAMRSRRLAASWPLRTAPSSTPG